MTIRPVSDADWPRVGELGELLVRTHHAFDASRFLDPAMLRADVYASRLKRALAEEDAMIAVAEVDGVVAGYVFAGIEPESWKELRHRAGVIHDVIVDPDYRGSGVGRALLANAIDWCTARGLRRVMLGSASSNVAAQRLFRDVGFRPTMIEMTLDRD
jgi:ribosomal protein S18 acetylase RimI-like enzyme